MPPRFGRGVLRHLSIPEAGPVYSSKGGDRYLTDRKCMAFAPGQDEASKVGDDLHELEMSSVADAERRGKTPCLQCAGGG